MNNPISSILRDAAAPLLLLGAIATAGIAAIDVWVAAALAAGPGPVPALSFDLPLRVARDGIHVVLSPAASTTAFVTALAALVGVELAAVAGVVVMSTRGGRLGDPRRALLRRRDLGDLSGRGSARRARHLRPSLDQRGDVPAAERGIRMVRIAGRDVWMSWEDVALVIMGPRSNKTSAVAVPAVLSAPGLVVATSNKADLWALTSGLRGQVGAVWTFVSTTR